MLASHMSMCVLRCLIALIAFCKLLLKFSAVLFIAMISTEILKLHVHDYNTVRSNKFNVHRAIPLAARIFELRRAQRAARKSRKRYMEGMTSRRRHQMEYLEQTRAQLNFARNKAAELEAKLIEQANAFGKASSLSIHELERALKQKQDLALQVKQLERELKEQKSRGTRCQDSSTSRYGKYIAEKRMLQRIGDRIYLRILSSFQCSHRVAGKITGMILELEEKEINEIVVSENVFESVLNQAVQELEIAGYLVWIGEAKQFASLSAEVSSS